MTDARLRGAVGSLALVGVALASYLLYIRWTGSALACTTGGCETVQASSYSKLLGVPVALLGLGAYVTILVCSFFRAELARAAAFSVALAGVGFAAYLLYVQLAVIHAVCEWCLASDVVITTIAMLAVLRLRVVN